MFKNILYSLFTKGFVALVNFLILIISSRYLGVSSRGEISIFLLNIAIIQVINEIYTGYSIVHFVPRYDLKKIVFNGLFYTLVFSALSNILIVALNKQVPGYSWMGYIMALLVLLNTFFCVLILAKENIRLYNILSFLQPLVLLLGILFYIFILKEYTIKAYIFPLFFSFLTALCISSFSIVRYLLSEPPGKSYRAAPVLWNGLIYQSGLLLFIFVNKYSYYLLPEAARVGLYSSSCSLMESVLIITNAIGPVLLARVANESGSAQNIRLTLTLGKFCFFLSLICVGLIFVIPEKVFLSILGAGFMGIKTSMMAYAPGVMMMSVFITIANYFSAIGRQKVILFCYGAGALSSLCLAPLLVAKYDVLGAAYTANISYFIITIMMCAAFLFFGDLSLKRLLSPFEDYAHLRHLLADETKKSKNR